MAINRITPWKSHQQTVYLLGDSALCANFLTGMGLNAGLMASDFLLRHLLDGSITKESTIAAYNNKMLELSNLLAERANDVAVPDWPSVEETCKKDFPKLSNSHDMRTEFWEKVLSLPLSFSKAVDILESAAASSVCHAVFCRGSSKELKELQEFLREPAEPIEV